MEITVCVCISSDVGNLRVLKLLADRVILEQLRLFAAAGVLCTPLQFSFHPIRPGSILVDGVAQRLGNNHSSRH
ncbi:hypothetical protein WN51_04839 [Melipona quadrifasciata]|uniref:Uncharacterized protein n=1 Tax=Melipona quadrifasciata TaxID=166423 RepID=A0A0M8ZV08_9HYME|nr:hypothetical protein WN51_04839 [Melipona quadrifasciata]